MKAFWFLILLLFFAIASKAQSGVDSIEIALKKIKSDTAKLSFLIRQSKQYENQNPQKALDFAIKTEAIIKFRKDDKIKADALCQIALCQLNLFYKDKAMNNIEQSIAIYKKINNDLGLVDALTIKGNIFDYQTEYTKAIECYNQTILLAEKINYKKGLALSLSSLGMIYYKVDNLNKAFENFTKSLEIYSLIKDKKGLARVYNNLGMLYDQKADYQKSLELYNKSYSINIELDNKRELAKLHTNIGFVYFQLKDTDKALKNFWQSVKIKQVLHDEFGIANSFNNIGGIFAENKKYDSTLFYMESALKIYTKLDDKRNIAMSLGNIGAVYKYMGKYGEALNFLNKSIKIRTGICDIKGIGRSYLSIGAIYEEKRNYHQATQFYKKALDCGLQSGDERLKMESNLRISVIYEKQNIPQEALSYYKKYHEVFDTIYNHQKQKQILELTTKYETAEKDNEIKLLSNKNEINQLKLEKSLYQVRKQKFIILVVVLIVVLLLCFLTVYFRLYKQKQKANAILKEKQIEIEQQNYEISFQRDSLENLNKELEIQKDIVMNQRDSIESELKKTLLGSEILQRENIQFKFEALKNQLNPHFLFNTYNTLISLIPADPQLAEKYTRNLSSVYRYILTSKDKELVKLQEEIDFINSYMFLIAIRFNDDVKLIVNIDREKLDYYIPLLSLQLLIENAVKHNIISNKKPLTITIKNQNSSIIIENNLQKKSSIENSTRIGLQNLINRYKLICDETVYIEQSSGHFTVKLPLLKENKYL